MLSCAPFAHSNRRPATTSAGNRCPSGGIPLMVLAALRPSATERSGAHRLGLGPVVRRCSPFPLTVALAVPKSMTVPGSHPTTSPAGISTASSRPADRQGRFDGSAGRAHQAWTDGHERWRRGRRIRTAHRARHGGERGAHRVSSTTGSEWTARGSRVAATGQQRQQSTGSMPRGPRS